MVKVTELTGNEAVALAVKQCDVDVVAAYPITPQTVMVEKFSQYVANGEVKTQFVCTESEHSAMSACIGASLTGVRVFTATASQGLALMHEMLYIASGLRCPIVMGVANRALSAPLNIHCDHSDMMGSRDAGWIQIFTENTQEVYDTTIQAFKIAEKVLLPVTVNLDGFITSHCVEGVKVLKDTEVKKFLPKREADLKIDPNRPLTFGPLCLTDYHFEFKRQQEEAMKAALKQVKRVGVEFGRLARRKYGVLHPYKLGDAEVALVCLGSTAGTARLVVDRLRAQGKRVGVVRVRLYRPFPAKEFIRVAGHAKLVVVLDRAASPGGPVGPLGADVKATLYHAPARPEVLNVIYGLGGRDVTLSELKKVFDVGLRAARRGVVRRPVIWMGVRE